MNFLTKNFPFILALLILPHFAHASGITSGEYSGWLLFLIGVIITVLVASLIKLLFISKNKLKVFLYIIDITLLGTIIAIVILFTLAFLVIMILGENSGVDLFIGIIFGPISIPLVIYLLHRKMKPYFFGHIVDGQNIIKETGLLSQYAKSSTKISLIIFGIIAIYTIAGFSFRIVSSFADSIGSDIPYIIYWFTLLCLIIIIPILIMYRRFSKNKSNHA